MGDRADIVVVREDGTHERYRTGWAVDIDLDLPGGPTALLALLPELRQEGWWLDDTIAQGGMLVDLGRKVLRVHRARNAPRTWSHSPGPTADDPVGPVVRTTGAAGGGSFPGGS
ncbi:hypothetical protein ACIOMM_04985 [Streptomyces sp. NPDC087908]|uniref:hypothetical protein n=1 Tax=Streptomyces sp. NPDC087908 TaxID=3365820 RepID=UPI0037F1B370